MNMFEFEYEKPRISEETQDLSSVAGRGFEPLTSGL